MIYLPDPQFQDLASTGTDEVISSRLEPGVDPIAEAHRRGSILLVVRLGNIDLEAPNTPAMDAPNPYAPRPQMPPAPGAPNRMMLPAPQGAPPAALPPSLAPTRSVSPALPPLPPVGDGSGKSSAVAPAAAPAPFVPPPPPGPTSLGGPMK